MWEKLTVIIMAIRIWKTIRFMLRVAFLTLIVFGTGLGIFAAIVAATGVVALGEGVCEQMDNIINPKPRRADRYIIINK